MAASQSRFSDVGGLASHGQEDRFVWGWLQALLVHALKILAGEKLPVPKEEQNRKDSGNFLEGMDILS